MTSKEAKTHIIDTLNGDMNKEYFINELLPEILKDLNRLEALEKAQELEIENLKFIDNENKYQVAIRVLKEAFIVLGKSDIADTCWFKYLEELEKENQVLRKIKEKAICEMQKAREKMDFYAQSEQYKDMYAFFNGVYKGLQEVIENESKNL